MTTPAPLANAEDGQAPGATDEVSAAGGPGVMDEAWAERRYRLTVAAILVVVACVRWTALDSAPLWHDELWLRDIVAQPGLGEVAQASRARDDLPVPAPLTLALMHVSARVIGSDARELRVLPWLAGLVSLALAAGLVRRFGGRRVALLTLLLMATSPLYAYYSEEAKQYGLDMAWTLATLAAFEGQWRPGAGRGRRWLFAGVALLAALSSYTMVFVFPALLLVSLWRGDGARRAWGAVVSGVCGLAGFALIVTLALPQVAPVLTHFWRPLFPPRTGLGDVLIWLGQLVLGLANTTFNWHFGQLMGPLDMLLGLVIVAVFGVGAVGLFGAGARARGCGRLALYLWVPVALLLGACLARRYPLGPRLLLFHSPLVVMVCALGLSRLAQLLEDLAAPRRTATALAVLVALAPGTWLLGNPFGASTKTQVEPLQVLESLRISHPRDPVFLLDAMVPQLAWVWWLPDTEPLMRATGTPPRWWFSRKIRQVLAASPTDRFWLVHIRPFGGQAEVMHLLPTSWRVTSLHDANGCRIVCLERGAR